MESEASGAGGMGLGAAARVFLHQPDRIAAAWRRLRYSALPRGEAPQNLLDDVVEPFVMEVGRMLAGDPVDPWTRTQGVLRLPAARGVRCLHEEFRALRKCMTDALEALGSPEREKRLVHAALDDALDSAVVLCQRLKNPDALGEPLVPFGGVVLELFEQLQDPPTVIVHRSAAH